MMDADNKAHESILQILKESICPLINDVTEEGDGDERHIIVTVDLGDGYRLVRLDALDLGPDYLDHDEE